MFIRNDFESFSNEIFYVSLLRIILLRLQLRLRLQQQKSKYHQHPRLSGEEVQLPLEIPAHGEKKSGLRSAHRSAQ